MIDYITQESIQKLRVSSLPTRPSSPSSAGGAGYSSYDIKCAFDALPMYIIEKYNELVASLHSVGDSALSAEIYTGLEEGHTLSQLFYDIKNGNLAAYMSVGEFTLATELAQLREKIKELEERIENG